MIILFWNSSAKLPKSDIFGPKFKDFYFCTNFATRQIQGRRFQIWQQHFQIPARKWATQAFLIPNLGICLREILQLDKFGVLVSNMTILFSNSTLKIRKSGIFGPKTKDFYFAPDFAIRQIRGRWFQIWFQSDNTQINQFLSLSVFYFCMKLRILKNSRVGAIHLSEWGDVGGDVGLR